jgi:hypothetical protein
MTVKVVKSVKVGFNFCNPKLTFTTFTVDRTP